MDIDAVSLDLDDTLWAFAPAQVRAQAALRDWLRTQAPTTGALLAETDALTRFRAASAVAHPEWAGRPDLVRRDSIRSLLAAANAPLSLADPAYAAFHAARQRVDLYEDVLPALRCLSTRFRLIAITNGNSDLVATGVGAFFEGAVTAYEVGHAKPDARIFHAAAEALGVAPQRMLHVGDDRHLDVIGAKGAGLQAAWIVRGGVATEDVRSGEPLQPDLVVRCLRELCAALGLSAPPQPADEALTSA